MAFGFTGTYVDPATGEEVAFDGPWEHWERKVKLLPAGSIKEIHLYNHGAPGEIDGQDADYIAKHLGPKMAPGGAVDISGCNTAGFIPNRIDNPLQGVNSLTAMIFYNGLPQIVDNEFAAQKTWLNLASDLSTRLPGVYVSGLSGFGLPFSRLQEYLFGVEPGFAPSAMAASRRVYIDGKELPPERPILAPDRCGSAAECAEDAANAAEAAGGGGVSGPSPGKTSAESAAGRAGSKSASSSKEGTGAATAVSSDVSAPSAVSVTANDKKIAHRGSCHMAKTQGATDVCWAGGDDSPAAFENVGYMSALTDATTKTFIQGNPVWIQSARLATSMDPHPSKPLGVASGKPHMNEIQAVDWSPNVLFEGRSVVRADDATIQNMMNTIGRILAGNPPGAAGEAFANACPKHTLTPDELARLDELLSADSRTQWTEADKALAHKAAQDMINGATKANATLENAIRLTKLFEISTGAPLADVANFFSSTMGAHVPWDRDWKFDFQNTDYIGRWRDVEFTYGNGQHATMTVSHAYAAVSMKYAPYLFNTLINHDADIVDGILKGIGGWWDGRGFSMDYGYGDANQWGDYYGDTLALHLTTNDVPLSSAMEAMYPGKGVSSGSSTSSGSIPNLEDPETVKALLESNFGVPTGIPSF